MLTKHGLNQINLLNTWNINMKTPSLLFALSLTSLVSTPAMASCTYKEAQTKQIEFNNMMQVYNRQFIAEMEKSGEPSPALEQKRLAMAEESAAVGILLSEEYDNNPNIQSSDPVNPEICTQSDALMAKYAPEGYQVAPVTVGAQTVSADCSSTTLWERYGIAIQQQAALVSDGKITNDEVPAYMKLSTEVGEYSTTDLAKACDSLSQFEQKLAAE